MAIVTGQVAVLSTTDGVLVPAANANWRSVGAPSAAPSRFVVIVNTGAAIVYLGLPGVTSATGLPVAATNGSVSLWLAPDEAISARAASGTQTVAFFESGS